VEERFETEGSWTPEGLAKTVGPVFDKREPLDGFVVPPS
jgi:hypothetical protein